MNFVLPGFRFRSDLWHNGHSSRRHSAVRTCMERCEQPVRRMSLAILSIPSQASRPTLYRSKALIAYHWHDFIGNVGVFLVLLSYFLLQLERIDSSGMRYSLMNAVGAILICVSLFFNFNLSSLIIEICWLAISGYGIYRCLSKKRASRANA